MATPIPIKNIYYLLCYAWNRLAEGEVVDVSGIDSTELADLFATVLLNAVNHLSRRGLEQGYIAHEEELASIRGRINVVNTMRRMLVQHGKASCTFDEFTVNTLPNRIIKSTLRHLAGAPGIDATLRKNLIKQHRDLLGIDDVPLTRLTFRKIQLHANNRFYKFVLNVCEMVQASWLIDEKTGQYKFRDFVRDDKAMARLFEGFLFNFYRLELKDQKVKKEKIKWSATSETDPDLSLLPVMETDISIRNEKRTLVMDAKYYSNTLQSYFEKESVHSANLYQLVAYLKNLESREGSDGQAVGMLVYPYVNKKLRESYTILGHRISVNTVDLTRDWKDIRKELLEIASSG